MAALNEEIHEEDFDWVIGNLGTHSLHTDSQVVSAFADTDVACFSACSNGRVFYASTGGYTLQQSFSFALTRMGSSSEKERREFQATRREKFLNDSVNRVDFGLSSWAAIARKPQDGLTCTLRVNIKQGNQQQSLWSEEKTCQLKKFRPYQFGRTDLSLKQEDGPVTISFHIKLSHEKCMSPPMTMSQFATHWLGKTDWSDVVVVSGEKSFNCHKIILAGRSEVFERMLNSQFKEAIESKIEIAEFEPDVVELLIKYVYSDDVLEDSISWELFEAAKMYEITRLQELCLKYLRKNISVQNCCRMLEASMVHDLEDYFIFAMDFFKNNKEEVSKTDGWKRVLTSNALLGKIIVYLM